MRDGISDDVRLENLHDFSHKLAPQLRNYLEPLLLLRGPDGDISQNEAIFWMLFTGTIYEQTNCRHKGDIIAGRVQGCWFTPRLRRQAVLLELTGWEHAKRLLEEEFVLQEDWLNPPPAEWYDTVMAGPIISTLSPSTSSSGIEYVTLLKSEASEQTVEIDNLPGVSETDIASVPSGVASVNISPMVSDDLSGVG